MIRLQRIRPLALTLSLGVAACNTPSAPPPSQPAVASPQAQPVASVAATSPVVLKPLFNDERVNAAAVRKYVQPSSVQNSYEAQLLLNGQPLMAGSDFRPLPAARDGAFSGAVVFVGYGISQPNYDDYDGINVSGKVVLALRDQPPHLHQSSEHLIDTKVRTAMAHGACAILLVSESLSEMADEPTPIPAMAVTSRVANLLLTTADQSSLQDFKSAIDALDRPKSTALNRVTVSGSLQRR